MFLIVLAGITFAIFQIYLHKSQYNKDQTVNIHQEIRHLKDVEISLLQSGKERHNEIDENKNIKLVSES